MRHHLDRIARPGSRGARLLAALACVVFGAAPCWAASLISTSTTNNSFWSFSRFYAHCVNGYYWMAFHDGTGPVLFSSRDGVTWSSQGSIFSSFNPGVAGLWAVRYSGSRIIAFGYRGSDTLRYYRTGTLNSDGTITWSAAETSTGISGAANQPLNALIGNSKPIMWRADTTAPGRFTIGSQLVGPTWTDTADAPALTTATSGGFSAGAIFQTGGGDPNDLIVIRATTTTVDTPGAHRVVAVKYDASANAFDSSWYNVSTLNGGITPENNTTEVDVTGSDQSTQNRFAAVRDTSGTIHVVYVNQNTDMVHYRKDVGFNDSWSRVSAGINPTAETIDKVGLTALANNNLLLFYSKSDENIYYRRFNGTSWGPESGLKTDGIALNNAFGTLESAAGCAVGVAWNQNPANPRDVMFSLDTGMCPELNTTEGSGTVTVTAPASFEMTFNTAFGGSLRNFYDLAEDPGRVYDLAGKPSANLHGLFHSSMVSGGIQYTTGTNDTGAKLDLLEATATRVRVRQEVFQQQVPPATGILGGVKEIGDYSVYPQRVALRWNRRTTASVSQSENTLEIAVRRETSPDPRNNLNPYSETDNTFPNPAIDDFVLAEREVAGVRTDFLAILNADWPLADTLTLSTTAAFFSWRDNAPTVTLPPGLNETWNFLIYYKPTNLFLNNTNLAVTSRRTDYRSPDALSVTPPASGWFDVDENTSSPSDFYNESEAAYTLDLDPASGLTFDIDGAATTRYHPFFKIRQWRSMQDPSSVTLEGATLANDVDYKADVKPMARAHFAQDVLWHSTLQDAAAVTGPDVGSAGTVNGTTTFVAGRYGQGGLFDAGSESISFSSAGNFNKNQGAVELWYQPQYAHDDSVQHVIWENFFDSSHIFQLVKVGAGANANDLIFFIQNATGPSNRTEVGVDRTDYSWRANDWVHLRVTWDTSAALGDQVRIFVNGVEPPHTDPANPYNAATMSVGTIYFGSTSSGALTASGIIDEFHVYDSPAAPTPLAHGGLTSNATEYLASRTNNFQLSFSAVDGGARGEYLYLGSDSKFRGVNVILATLGATLTSLDLQWQYWNGSSWANLESVAGFTDQTNHLRGNGTVFWTADPPSWSPYSVNGGPDLYYVRAYLASGSYSTSPVEGLIKTDILLFQYCGDITLDAQTFSFAAPVPTAVELTSFEARGVDGAVELVWQTGSELRNLGFHLHRASSKEGPYERITSSLISGLGSSPVGASYSYVDSGLTNGVTYFYKLEDVETTGKTELHGPVSATPQAGVVSGTAESQQGSTSSPASVSSLSRITYGDPSAVSLRVLERGLNQVVLELTTGGFYATPQADGTVRIEIPGFEETAAPGAPAIPVKRTFVEAAVGRRVRLLSVQPSEVTAFSLRPMAAEAPAMVVSPDGTVRAGRRRTPAAFRADGLSPEEAARILSVGFQGEIKKALLELAPMRWDPSSAQLLLARRLIVRVAFAGLDPAERPLGGSRGRRHRESTSHGSREVLARLVARGKGLYRVSYEETFGARGRPLRASEIRLSRQGQAVGFHLEPENGSFGPGSVLYFLSEGASLNPYGDAVVYELERGQGGVLMPVASASPWGPTTPYCFQHGQWEKNRTYQAGLLGAPDIWLWDAVFSRVVKSYPFALRSLASSTEPARLSVEIQGGSDFEAIPDHHLRLYVNGLLVAETSWDGKTPQGIEADIAPGILRDGDNLLQIENVGDTAAAYSLVFLNRFALTYPRLTVAEAGVLEGSWSASGTAEIAGLTTGAVLDTTEETPRWLRGALSTATGLAFRAEAGQSYLAVGEGALLRPELRRPTPSTLKSTNNRADYLLIAPGAFLAAAEPLLQHRRSQGLLAKAVPIEEVYEQFGYGESRPEAVKEFLSYAYHHWQAPSVRYVLLLGDATYDFKNDLGTGVVNRVPPLMVKTSYLWTASDPTYAAINGEDGLPDLAIGRLPASSYEEAQRLVAKILAFETGGGDFTGPAVLVADNGDKAGNFEADAEEIASTLLATREVERIYLSNLGSATRSAILSAFDRGVSLLSYIGHGGIAVWASENIFNNLDVRTLAPQAEQPLVLTLNCLNGYFHFPSLNSLAEELLKAEGKGAIAAFSPTGLSLNDAAHTYHKALLGELISGRHERLGDALLAAQAAYADSGAFPELLSIYHLLGDPALRLR